jgi:hypothetical protein
MGMMRPARVLLAAIALLATIVLLARANAGSADTQPAPIVVPLHLEHSRYRVPYLGLDVAIGSVTKRLEVATAAPGVRILKSAVPADAFGPTGYNATGDFGNGFALRGAVVMAQLGIGGVRSEHTVQVQAVESVTCASWLPKCSAANGGTPDEFGRVFPGVAGLLMTSPAPGECCVNPLYDLTGHVGRNYILHADFAKPSLTLNPDATLLAKFSTVSVPLSATSWPDGCITVKDVQLRVCGQVSVDTGFQDLVIQDPSPVIQTIFPGGTVATLTVGSWKHGFTSGGQGDERYTIFSQRGERKRIVLGLGALQDVDVYFDLEHGRLGFLSL